MFAEYRNSQLVGVMKSFGCAPSVVDDDLSPDRVARNARAVWIEICDDHDLQSRYRRHLVQEHRPELAGAPR
jgi:hypothetical protein